MTTSKKDTVQKTDAQNTLAQAALDYHRYPTPGKISIVPTKDMTTQRDLALAYSPGVAVPCEEIAADPSKARDYTSKGNLVAVISNGTAVLGLGNIGALASKPVMEGKSVLFKKFANIDSIDLEVDETDVDKFIEIVAALEPTFGGINLEDIKAPECFEIETRLKARMNIPVFHDDQHGTAIIVAAATMNWAKLTNRDLSTTKIVASGAGAAALSCLNILMRVGIKKENIIVCDREGVVYAGRNVGMDKYKAEFAIDTPHRTLEDVIKAQECDVFLGLSAAGALSETLLPHFKKDPLILALANPTPEIMPELVYAVRPDAFVATGRSDYANQVNNVLCFPFLFRGALDVGAREINEEMKFACAQAIAALAQKEAHDTVIEVYAGQPLEFGKEYLIPKPFDPRLMTVLPVAVAKAAIASGVAERPIEDWAAYERHLQRFTNQTTSVMEPIFAAAKKGARTDKQRMIYAEAEEPVVLRAAQTVVDEGLAHPVLVGRRAVIEARIQKLSLRLQEGRDYTLVDPENDERYHGYVQTYQTLMARRGVTPLEARTIMRTNTTVIAAMLLEQGVGDAMVCGVVGKYHYHLNHVCDIVGLRDDVAKPAAMVLLLTDNGNIFITDTHVTENPTAEDIAHMTVLAAEEVKRFGLTPKVALLSHSNFGSHQTESAQKMRDAMQLLKRLAPTLQAEGEMHADTALSQDVRDLLLPQSQLQGAANLLVMPNLDAANIAYNIVKIMASGVPIGPMLLGLKAPVHIVTNAIKPRGLVNITALAATQALGQVKSK